MGFWDYVPHTWTGLAVAPLTPLYALGAGINELTGGSSTTWSPVAAVQGGVQGTTYSPTTQALSGYTDPTPNDPLVPGGGSWGIPLINPATPRVVGGIVESTLEGLGLPKLSTLAIAAAAIGVVLLSKK